MNKIADSAKDSEASLAISIAYDGVLQLRVIAGRARGTRLVSREGLEVRPTLDRVKEAMFSMLTGRVAGRETLDLFAGSGALGIEALSRGASHCVFVDSSAQSAECIRKNLELTHLSACADVFRQDAVASLAGLNRKFGLILMDPPYGKGLTEQALEAIRRYDCLAEGGLILCELDAVDSFDPCGFIPVRDKRYGRVRVVLLSAK